MLQTKESYHNAIKNKLKEYGYSYIIVDDLNKTKLIYELFVNNIMMLENEYINDSMMMNYIGLYYRQQKDYENMKKYYLMAINHGNDFAMNNLGLYYRQQKDYENMKKYYLMAINHGNNIAMNNLGHYYLTQKDYENMIKYYLMAIEHGYNKAMYNLGLYYKYQKDYENMEKYCLMAIEHGNNDAMNVLGQYYYEQKDYENMEKYYLMALDNNYNDERIYSSLLKYYLSFNFVDKYIDFIIVHIDNIQCKNEMNNILSDDMRSEFYINYIRNKRSTQLPYNTECPICLGENNNMMIKLRCKHQLCLQCLRTLLSTKKYICPICKTQIS